MDLSLRHSDKKRKAMPCRHRPGVKTGKGHDPRSESSNAIALAFSLHLLDTRGLGLANLLANLQAGVRIFDAALGGLGGCPFIPAASGNITTEDAGFALTGMRFETGID